MAAADDLDRVIEQYHQALDEFSRGNPDRVKDFYSDQDDVTIANPFFPLTRGHEQVVERLERSVENFRDGDVGFQSVAKWVSDQGGASPRRSHNHGSAGRVGDTGVDLPLEPNFGELPFLKHSGE